jgi:4-hydroxy-tetrahydrodipicolinate reductase
MRLAIVGFGRMGRTIASLAPSRGHDVALIIDEDENPDGRGLTSERLRGIDAAMEFTTPTAAPKNLARLIDAGVPAVCGTTGWYEELPRISALVNKHRGGLVHAGNFSVGVQLFLRAAGDLARAFAGQLDFDVFLVEEHHARKLDAPSGTARALQERLLAADRARKFPITSIRAGSIPGIHSLTYDGPYDTVTLSHTARSREGFAAGALLAAEWLPGRTGVFTFDDVLFGETR